MEVPHVSKHVTAPKLPESDDVFAAEIDIHRLRHVSSFIPGQFELFTELLLKSLLIRGGRFAHVS